MLPVEGTGPPQPGPSPPAVCSTPLCAGPSPAPHASPAPTVLTGRCPHHPHSLEDSTLLQAVLATVPHGCIVYSLDGPVDGLEDILLQALEGGGAGVGS